LIKKLFIWLVQGEKIMGVVLIKGCQKGMQITWELGVKVVLPIYIIVTLLNYTPIISLLSGYLTPLMQLVGLPGEAALPVALAALVNVYAGIGAMLPLGLDSRELTIVGAMVLMAHELPVEAAVSKKTGSNVISLVCIRLLLAIILAVIINLSI